MREVTHRGVVLRDLDVDAVIKRKPRTVLVDAARETLRGDKVMTTDNDVPLNFQPMAPRGNVKGQIIDLESLFFDYTVQPGAGAAQTFDKFEYIDRDFIGATTPIPWDFEYGCDIFGGNQRYDNWYQRMDREEIAMYSAMLDDKTKTPGQENNVNITNLFGSILLGGNPSTAVAGAFPSYLCAIGQAGDPAQNCASAPLNGAPANAPLDPTNPSGAPACSATGTCPGTMVCAAGYSYENGFVQNCGAACDFTTYPTSGCQSPTQTCAALGAAEGCLDMMMDKNGPASAVVWADELVRAPPPLPIPGRVGADAVQPWPHRDHARAGRQAAGPRRGEDHDPELSHRSDEPVDLGSVHAEPDPRRVRLHAVPQRLHAEREQGVVQRGAQQRHG